FEDLFRTAPFDPATTIPDASVETASVHATKNRAAPLQARWMKPATMDLCRNYFSRVKDLPVFHRLIERGEHAGSNEWGVDGRHTDTGHAMIANDTHLTLGLPGLWHPIHLRAGNFEVAGCSVAGVPFVILGHNRNIAWGATTSYADVTDTFQEQIAPDANS